MCNQKSQILDIVFTSKTSNIIWRIMKMRAKANPLFEKELDVDCSALKDIDALHATSWSQIEMQCAVHGIEITYDVFKVFLVASGIYENMYALMMKCIAKTDFLTKFAGNDEVADVIYFMSNPDFMKTRLFMNVNEIMTSRWDANDVVPFMFVDWNYDTNEIDVNASVKRMYKMMSAFDKRFPLMFVKFFYRHKRQLFMHDKEFVNWVFKKMELKSKACPQVFKKVFDAMTKEKCSLQSTSMFMS